MNSIPATIGEVYVLVQSEVQWLHGRWICYRQLFGESERRVEMLNECAGTFFFFVQDVLFDEVMLTLSKLTDPAGGGLTSKLSLKLLQKRLDAQGHHSLAASNQLLLNTLDQQCEPFKNWRNKKLAHLDLQTMQAHPNPPLPGVSRQMIEDALSTIRGYMNAIESHYNNSEIGYEHFIMHSDGDALLAVLRNGLRYEELLQEDLIPVEDLHKGKWHDA